MPTGPLFNMHAPDDPGVEPPKGTTMSNYSKFIGSIVGGVIGIGLVWIGMADSAGIPAAYQPFVDALTMMITSAIGTYIAPANKA